ncbi:MAG: hypothetical protein WAV95_04185 [Azonexus sp.]
MSFAIPLRGPLLVLMIILAGCATPPPVSELAPPPVQIAESTWQQVDTDIVAESLAATGPASRFARDQMEHWRLLVTQRAEADFIPWYSSYLTQQWLTAKVAWYTMNADQGEPPVSRLAAYLQEQYFARVLGPVATEVDPAAITAQATKHYVLRLAGQLQAIPGPYGIPVAQFEQRLKAIPVIALAPPAPHDASLYQLVQADPLDSLPAYAALLRQIREAGGYADAGLSKTRISPVARRVSEELLNRLAITGGTSAVTTLIGGVAGTVISIGAAGVGVMLHEAKRGGIEAQLRETLNASMEDMWQILMEDSRTGVTAGIYYLSDRIGKSLPQTFTQPVRFEDMPQEIPLPELPPVQGEIGEAALPEAPESQDRQAPMAF